MAKVTVALCLQFALILVSFKSIANDLSPSIIINQTSQYNGQEITVTGTVKDFKQKVSHRGNNYETYKLCDIQSCISVFAWGMTPHNDGDKVTVSGQFMKIKHVGQYTFYNELDVRQ